MSIKFQNNDTTSRWIRIMGFTIAAAGDILAARIMPEAAVAITTVVLVGVLLTHTEELTSLVDVYVKAVKVR